jgi:aryl-alcohol dehydrogenase-like predicted oxidoreductase
VIGRVAELAEARGVTMTEVSLAWLLAKVASPVVGDELEAYRRAERAERLARDRAAQIYEQANAALADATLKVEAISDGMNTISQQVTAQIQQAKQDMQEAVASLYAIRPTEE